MIQILMGTIKNFCTPYLKTIDNRKKGHSDIASKAGSIEKNNKKVDKPGSVSDEQQPFI